jgi:hypothetical protein
VGAALILANWPIIETEVLDHVTDPNTLADYKANKAAIGGGVSAHHVAGLTLNAYNLPPRVWCRKSA